MTREGDKVRGTGIGKVLPPVRRRATDAFTLIELLAVVTIIVLMIGMILGAATYLDRKAKYSQVNGMMQVLANACDAFHNDVGRYPTSSIYRHSETPPNYWDFLNNATLLDQLNSGRGYLHVSALHIKLVKTSSWDPPPCITANGCDNQPGGKWSDNGFKDPGQWHTNILDAWGIPFHYYCTYPPQTTFGTVSVIRATCTYAWSSGLCYTAVSSWGNYAATGYQVNLQSYDLWSEGPNHFNEFGRNDDISNFRLP